MIPRETLKQIQQIELRTNRLVTAFAVSVAGLLIGCSATNVPQRTEQHVEQIETDSTNTGFAGVIIFPAETTGSAHLIQYLLPLWNPTTNQVTEALELLPGYLRQTSDESEWQHDKRILKVQERIPRTLCQVVGVTFEGEKGIFLNCSPADSHWTHDWKERLIKVQDGGSRFWRIVYLPETKKFTRLHIDHGF